MHHLCLRFLPETDRDCASDQRRHRIMMTAFSVPQSLLKHSNTCQGQELPQSSPSFILTLTTCPISSRSSDIQHLCPQCAFATLVLYLQISLQRSPFKVRRLSPPSPAEEIEPLALDRSQSILNALQAGWIVSKFCKSYVHLRVKQVKTAKKKERLSCQR